MSAILNFPSARQRDVAAGAEKEARGVYFAPALSNGARVAYAITREGHEIGRTVVPAGMDEDRIVCALYDFLDDLDPVPPARPR